MTKQELLKRAEELEAQEFEADGMWAEYLHAKAEGLRLLAIYTPDDREGGLIHG